MNRFGVNVELKNVPVLDPDFIPLMRFNRAFLEGAKKPLGIAVERADLDLIGMAPGDLSKETLHLQWPLQIGRGAPHFLGRGVRGPRTPLGT